MPTPTSNSSHLSLPSFWPDAAASLREGLPETLTLMRLGIGGSLAKTLSSTYPIESMIEIARHTQRNVKRWQDGDMRKRWTAAGMLQASSSFDGSSATATSPRSSPRSNNDTTPSTARTPRNPRR
jgi:putative transposase